jgi:L-threonylcarbamoyladenylate synthase
MRAGKIIKSPSKAVEVLNGGGVGVLLTDTIYGLFARALDKKAVNYIRQIKDREENKSFIVLISSIKDISKFGIKIDKTITQATSKLWPGKVSIVIGCKSKKFAYIHGNKHTIAFRLPEDEKVLRILRETGPLIAPSANPKGLKPATSVSMAKR